MENEQIKIKQATSKPLYMVGTALGIVGLLGGLFCFLFIWTVVDISTSNESSGMHLDALKTLFWIPACAIADLMFKLEASGYFAVMCILAVKRKVLFSNYKLPFLLTGICLFLFFLISQFILTRGL